MKNLKVEINLGIETVYFIAKADGCDAETIKIEINRDPLGYVISSPELGNAIKFCGISKSQAKLKLKAIEAAVNWINSDQY